MSYISSFNGNVYFGESLFYSLIFDLFKNVSERLNVNPIKDDISFMLDRFKFFSASHFYFASSYFFILSI